MEYVDFFLQGCSYSYEKHLVQCLDTHCLNYTADVACSPVSTLSLRPDYSYAISTSAMHVVKHT